MLDLIPSRMPPPPDLDTASPALLGRRGLATAFDVAFCYFTFDAVMIAAVIGIFPDWAAANSGTLFVDSLILLIPIYLTYVFILEWRFARTPGKVWQGLMVTTVDGKPPSLVESGIRNLGRYVDWLPVFFLLGWLIARRSETGQRVGDRLAGTVVVRPDDPMAHVDVTPPPR